MSTNLTGGSTSNLDALAVAGAADFGTPTYAGVAMGRMVLGTAQATTSGTSIDFTGIPSWVKKLTFRGRGVSTSGASAKQLQLGSGSIVTSGYLSQGSGGANGNVIAGFSMTSGFGIGSASTAANTNYFSFFLTHEGGNVWSYTATNSGNGGQSEIWVCGGEIALSGTLDRIRLTTVNGTDTFDAGSVNILYEG